MKLEPMGEWAVRAFDLPAPAASVAHAIAQLPGVIDAVPTADCVGIFFDANFEEALLQNLQLQEALYQPQTHEVPVCYDLGFDLESVCERLKLTPQEFIDLHTGSAWPCFAIGFCPGFAYLGPVAESLQGIPRLSSPRVRTLPGSVGLTGSQTAVYPLVRPGGWPIVGMTPLTLVDVEDRYFPISVGDSVRFRAINETDFAALKGERL